MIVQIRKDGAIASCNLVEQSMHMPKTAIKEWALFSRANDVLGRIWLQKSDLKYITTENNRKRHNTLEQAVLQIMRRIY